MISLCLHKTTAADLGISLKMPRHFPMADLEAVSSPVVVQGLPLLLLFSRSNGDTFVRKAGNAAAPCQWHSQCPSQLG